MTNPPSDGIVDVTRHLGSVTGGTRGRENRVLQHHRPDLSSEVDRPEELPQESFSPSRCAGVHLLQAQHRQRMAAPFGYAGCGSSRGGDGREAGNLVKLCLGPDVGAVGARAAASRRVHDQLDGTCRDQLGGVRRSGLSDLGRDRSDGYLRASRDKQRCPTSRRSRTRARGTSVASSSPAALSRSARDMNTVPESGSGVPAAIWLFANAIPKVVPDSHHLAGGAHLGPEQGVGPGKAAERENGLLDAHVSAGRTARSAGLRTAARASVDPSITRAATIAIGHPGRLRDERHRATRSRIRLEHVRRPLL